MMSNLEAARSGNRRQALEQLRDTLASLLDTTEAQVHAQLAGQYRAVLAELASMEEVKPGKVISARERLADRIARADAAL